MVQELEQAPDPLLLAFLKHGLEHSPNFQEVLANGKDYGDGGGEKAFSAVSALSDSFLWSMRMTKHSVSLQREIRAGP